MNLPSNGENLYLQYRNGQKVKALEHDSQSSPRSPGCGEYGTQHGEDYGSWCVPCGEAHGQGCIGHYGLCDRYGSQCQQDCGQYGKQGYGARDQGCFSPCKEHHQSCVQSDDRCAQGNQSHIEDPPPPLKTPRF